jgi:hypothetical protein
MCSHSFNYKVLQMAFSLHNFSHHTLGRYKIVCRRSLLQNAQALGQDTEVRPPYLAQPHDTKRGLQSTLKAGKANAHKPEALFWKVKATKTNRTHQMRDSKHL